MKSVDYFPINVERTQWGVSKKQISNVRHKVFVEEQNVPVELDIDGEDDNAIHWLAFIEGERRESDAAIATARLLPDGTIGRMAVIRDYREMGVGSSLMRHIINYAIRKNIPELTLAAQLQAIPFYEGFGFQPEGEVFEDAGIDHRTMRLSLHLQRQRYQQQNKSADEKHQRIPLKGKEEFSNAAATLIDQSRKRICIFSNQLLPEIYDEASLCEHFYNFVIQHPSAHIKILLKDIEWLARNTHRLHELGIRLSSHIELRKLNPKSTTLHTEFMVTDETGILYQQEEKRLAGYLIRHAPREARELTDEFDAMWEHGLVDTALRRLHI